MNSALQVAGELPADETSIASSQRVRWQGAKRAARFSSKTRGLLQENERL